MPQAKFVDESVEVPVMQERTSSLGAQTTIQKTTEISKLQHSEQEADVLVEQVEQEQFNEMNPLCRDSAHHPGGPDDY